VEIETLSLGVMDRRPGLFLPGAVDYFIRL
jgi:hypothetical protein